MAIRVKCEKCGKVVEKRAKTAKYCSPKCRSAAGDDRKREARTSTGVNLDLIDQVRRRLAKADRLNTVEGALALTLAARVADPSSSSLRANSALLLEVLDTIAPVDKSAADGSEQSAVDQELAELLREAGAG